jgi:hypothetical protein
VAFENHRRAVRILLALQAWKLDKGTYPKTLDELVGPYLKSLPNDPYCAQPYLYYPEGLKEALQGRDINLELTSPGKDKPFIWSTGPNISMLKPSAKQFMYRYEIYDTGGRWHNFNWTGFFRPPQSMYEIFSNGRFFYLPE